MGISIETRLVNYIFNSFLHSGLLKKGLIDHKIRTDDGCEPKPDVFAYLEKDPTYKSYFLCELKKRSTFPASDIARINTQLNKYLAIKPTDLDRTMIPIMNNSKIGLYYLSPNSDIQVLNQIKNTIQFPNQTSIILIELRNNINKFKIVKHSSNIEFQKICNILKQASKNKLLLQNIIIPFLPNDLSGITGLGGSEVKINLKVEIQILVSHLMSLIVQRKYRDEDPKFKVSDYFDHLYSKTKGLLYFDKEDRTFLERKLRLFLNYVVDVCKEKNLILIEDEPTSSNVFIIRLRKTQTLVDRLESFNEEIYRYIDNKRKQKELPDFF